VKPSSKLGAVILAKRHPESRFFGLDASEAMLEMADAKIDTARLRNITLANELADSSIT
jgi:tRNA G46 methylase TrmB